MSQRVKSFYKLITLPIFYELVQSALGRKRTREYLCKGPLKTRNGDKILDVGCGPATLRPFLGDVDNLGMDMNPKHIEKATETYGHMGQFICGNAVTDIKNASGPYDIIICIGLLHHLDDHEAIELLDKLSDRLSPHGRIVTYDPVYIDKQNLIAKTLNDLDSGQNIRTAEGYISLFNTKLISLRTDVLSGMLNVPYNHCCNIATKKLL